MFFYLPDVLPTWQRLKMLISTPAFPFIIVGPGVILSLPLVFLEASDEVRRAVFPKLVANVYFMPIGTLDFAITSSLWAIFLYFTAHFLYLWQVPASIHFFSTNQEYVNSKRGIEYVDKEEATDFEQTWSQNLKYNIAVRLIITAMIIMSTAFSFATLISSSYIVRLVLLSSAR
jgi:hypothetical protein